MPECRAGAACRRQSGAVLGRWWWLLLCLGLALGGMAHAQQAAALPAQPPSASAAAPSASNADATLFPLEPEPVSVPTPAQFGDSLVQEVRLLYVPQDGLYFSSASVLMLPASVRAALEQGIPVYFMAEVRLTRPRWWLLSHEDAFQQRFWRLSYQPLTRKWRVQMSSISSEHTDQPTGLAQAFDSLADALASMQRIAGWKVARSDELRPGTVYDVEFAFGLDKRRIPRPLQISEVGRASWDLELVMHRLFEMPSLP